MTKATAATLVLILLACFSPLAAEPLKLARAD